MGLAADNGKVMSEAHASAANQTHCADLLLGGAGLAAALMTCLVCKRG